MTDEIVEVMARALNDCEPLRPRPATGEAKAHWDKHAKAVLSALTRAGYEIVKTSDVESATKSVSEAADTMAHAVALAEAAGMALDMLRGANIVEDMELYSVEQVEDALDAALSSFREKGSGWRKLVDDDDGENPAMNEIVLLAWRDWRSNEWCFEAGPAHFGREGVNGTMSWHGSATHWRPLPIPPTPTEGGGDE